MAALMRMEFGNPVNGVARDPWHLGPGELAAVPIVQGRPSWQVTRWPVSGDEFRQLAEAAREPEVTALEASAAVADAGTPAATAPTLDSTFDGIAQTGLDPPDPALAVGPDDVMTAVNAQFAVTSKSSPQPLEPVPFSALFGPVLPPDASFLFDPKLAYDHFAQRWIALVGAKRENPPGSWIMLAVTQTADPRGAWYTWALDASLDGATPTANWADFPALGFDEQAIYLAVNMFAFGGGFQYAKLRILNKGEVYATAGLAAPALRWFDVSVILNPDHRTVFTLQPAIHHRSAPGPAHFVNALWPSGTSLTTWTLTDPLAPAGGPKIMTDDARLLNAVYHGDGPAKGLWTAHTSRFTWPGDSEARSVVQWYQLDTGASRVVQQGRYGAPGIYQFFPAVQPIATGDAFIVFGRAGANDFAHLRAAGRQAADPPGTLSNSVVAQAGAGVYPGSRWGDYFSVASDPSDDGTAWVCGQYAGPAGTWATRVCSVFF